MLLKERHDFEAETTPRTFTPDLDAVGRHLMAGADRIRRKGWAQRALYEPKVGFCALGAMMMTDDGHVAVDGGVDYEARAVLRQHLRVISIADWNNAEGRTADEVIAALEQAALTRARSLLDRSA